MNFEIFLHYVSSVEKWGTFNIVAVICKQFYKVFWLHIIFICLKKPEQRTGQNELLFVNLQKIINSIYQNI